MNLFSAPTDSFYKFLAVAGLIFFIAGCVLLYQDNIYENNLIAKQSEDEQLLQKEIEVLSYELDYNLKYKSISDSIKIHFGISLEDIQPSDSISKLIIFNLPDKIQEQVKKLLFKKNKLSINKQMINDKISWNIGRFIIIIPLYLGEIFAMFGFLLWYEKIQRPINNKQISEGIQKYLEGEIWFENCQSCMKTFFYKDELGIEKDGSINKMFCKDCYTDGVFVEPELTLKEAIERLNLKLKEKKYWYIQKKVMCRKLKRLQRWNRNRIW